MRHAPLLAACSAIVLLAGACREVRDPAAIAPAYDPEIEQLLRKRCVRCHGDTDAAAGYRLDAYAGVLGCLERDSTRSAVEEGDAGVALLEALERTDHRRLLDAAQRGRLRAWVRRGAPLRDHGVHAPGILNPRSRDWHGQLAARDRFGPIRRASHPDACGRCHSGAPTTPERDHEPAPGATACTSCHAAASGVLACGTCHGDGGDRAHPPRDACAFPAPAHDAHRVHVESSALSAAFPLACTSCHPTADAALSGSHANGTVDVAFDPQVAGSEARFDPMSGICAVRCHQRGGTLETPRFDEPGPLGCTSCHGSPPDDHFAGPCTDCHREANASGTALTASTLHLNGRVDLGDGGGTCGACHGQGEDPMPQTPSHVLHRETRLTAEVTCDECHAVPETVTSEGHLDRSVRDAADLRWGMRATARGQSPSYGSGGCREIACHGGGLAEGIERALTWDAQPGGSCAGCHGLPPAKAHPADDRCASVSCHGGEVSIGVGTNGVTDQGRALHINGIADTVPRTTAQP